MAQSAEGRSRLLELYRDLAALHHRGDPAMRQVVALLIQRLEEAKDKLLSADPAQVPRLQGRASELKDLLDIISNARNIKPE